MLTLGITGGVASGKSLAAEYFVEQGAAAFDADRAGHEVLRAPEVREALVERFGSGILDPSGQIDRAAIARCVFGTSPSTIGDRTYLEKLVHPRIRARFENQRSELAGSRVLVVDAALLLEAGWNSACDWVVFVDSPRVLRQARAEARGWSAEQFTAREAAQWPVEKKRQASDHILPNDGTPEELLSRVRAFWRERVNPVLSGKKP